MDQDELLRRVVGALERLRIPYLVTGSMASIFFGEPRFTNDIDIVVSLSEDRSDDLADEFPAEDFYLDRQAAIDAVRNHRQFNLIHPRSGLKVDFVVASPTPFNESRFSRAKRVRPGVDFEAVFATPEDVILMKLDYFRRGGSNKHLRDVSGILAVSGEMLDESYIETWAERLGVSEEWRKARSR